MNPIELLRTVYLGDRACKGIYIKAWERRVELHVNCISRVRAASGHWNYYTDEDIYDGRLVFVGVEAFALTPPGLLPNDLITEFKIAQAEKGGLFDFTFQVDSVANGGTAKLVTILIRARAFHLEDPGRPEAVIDS